MACQRHMFYESSDVPQVSHILFNRSSKFKMRVTLVFGKLFCYFKEYQTKFSFYEKRSYLIGVSNGLCEHLRACEHCVLFCQHEQWSSLSCEQRALNENTTGEQRALRNFFSLQQLIFNFQSAADTPGILIDTSTIRAQGRLGTR